MSVPVSPNILGRHDGRTAGVTATPALAFMLVP